MKIMSFVQPSVDDVMHTAWINGENPFKDQAPVAYEYFCALFGCYPIVVLTLYGNLIEHNLIPDGGSIVVLGHECVPNNMASGQQCAR
jgi:hypothetical protein